jgi:hypothetical protein
MVHIHRFMVQTQRQLVFPADTVFLRIDGVLFASLPDERWLAVDDGGSLVFLTPSYAAELGRMTDIGEIVEESAFRTALADSAIVPDFD